MDPNKTDWELWIWLWHQPFWYGFLVLVFAAGWFGLFVKKK